MKMGKCTSRLDDCGSAAKRVAMGAGRKRKGKGRENEQNCETEKVQNAGPENGKKALDAASDAGSGCGVRGDLFIRAHDGDRSCI